MESEPQENSSPDDAPNGAPDDAATSETAPGRRRLLAMVAAFAVLLAGLLIAWSPWSNERPSAAVGAATTSWTPPTSTPTAESGDRTVAPLTGLPVAPQDSVRLLRPALIAKIDGARVAMPQVGLSSADIVMEARVEGISRYLAVWHSQDVGSVGPVRSARTTDPDLLAAYGRPLFSYSGGNTGVLRDLRRSDWFTDVSHDAVPGAYGRSGLRAAPHDLMADPADLWDRTPDELAIPPAQFEYQGVGSPDSEAAGTDSDSAAAPAAGFAVAVGSDARFVWDDEASAWRRFAYGIAHEDTNGEPLRFDNVVVLDVDYVRSPADRDSPEAVSVGSGPAWVFESGAVRAGSWNRADRESAWNLTDESGAALKLKPGTTWIVLADRAPLPLDGSEIAALLDDG